MSVQSKIVYLFTLFLGAWITWGILCLARTQVLTLISSGRFDFRDPISEGLFVVEGIGLLIWVVGSSLPVLFVAEKTPKTINTIAKGRKAAIVFCLFGLGFSLAIFIALPRGKTIHYQNFGLTKTLMPKISEKRFIPERYSQLDSKNQTSEAGRKAIDALVLGQVCGVFAIVLIFWVKFSDKVLNKDEYAEPWSWIHWIQIMREFNQGDRPEDEDELEF